MLVIMSKHATETQLEGVKKYLVENDYDFHQSTGVNRITLGVIGDTKQIDQTELGGLPGVLAVFKIPEEPD